MSLHGLLTFSLVILVVLLMSVVGDQIRKLQALEKKHEELWISHHAAIGAQNVLEHRINTLEHERRTDFPPNPQVFN